MVQGINCIGTCLLTKRLVITKSLKISSPSFLFCLKNATFRNVITEVSSLIRIILTLPVPRCSAERSFLGRRRLKTYLRSRMTQERLNALVLMNTHKDILGCLDIDNLVDNFISKSSVRKKTFMFFKLSSNAEITIRL